MADLKYIIKIEGQEINVTPDIGTLDDDSLKRALTPMFPGAANSRVERSEKEGTVTITVVKLAGSKGRGRKSKKGGGFAALLSCKGRRNPTVEFYLRLHAQDVGQMGPDQLIGLSGEIEKVLEAGQRQLTQVIAAHARLRRTTPQEGMDFVPVGF